MTYEQAVKNISIMITPQATHGTFEVLIRGFTLEGEMIVFDLELTECDTKDILMNTIRSTLEELLECRYGYEFSDYDPDDLLHDGGHYESD